MLSERDCLPVEVGRDVADVQCRRSGVTPETFMSVGYAQVREDKQTEGCGMCATALISALSFELESAGPGAAVRARQGTSVRCRTYGFVQLDSNAVTPREEVACPTMCSK